MKKINFIASTQQVYSSENPPIPAYQGIPDWFKNIPPERDFGLLNPRSKSTVKKCMPFLDALTTGYLLRCPQDIYVGKDINNNIIAEWSISRINPVPPFESIPVFDIDRPYDRYEGLQVNDSFNNKVWRMNVYPRIQTPDGYSVLITHPFNRYDLPFLTLSGIIDTDKLHGPMAVSMFLRDDFVGIIEKDTPVAQVFPFKREDWEHSIKPPYTNEESDKYAFSILSKMIRSYQKNFWSKKTYK